VSAEQPNGIESSKTEISAGDAPSQPQKSGGGNALTRDEKLVGSFWPPRTSTHTRRWSSSATSKSSRSCRSKWSSCNETSS